MKKVIFISALAIAAAVSCTKSDIVDTKFNDTIGFETYTGRTAQTKAESVESTAALQKTGFGVYGFYTGNDVWKESSTANLWANERVYWGTYTNEDNETVQGWIYDNTKYWTNASDQYTFLAYAPHVNAQNGIATYGEGETAGSLTVEVGTTVTTPSLTYVVPNTLKDQIDLLYANDESHINMKRPGDKATLKSVELTFKHALSRITVKASENVSAYDYIIKAITVSGDFNTSGVFDIKTGTWSDETSTNPEYAFYNGEATLTDEPTIYASNGYLMTIPTVTDEETTVTVTVTYASKFGTVISNDMTKEVEFTNTFVKGSAYAINLEFKENTDNPISFTVVKVETWGEDDLVPDTSLNPENGTVVPEA